MTLEIPIVHLNGTSKNSLLEALEDAHAKIREAVEALTQTAPNMRDWYPKKDATEAFERARMQHYARIQKLLDVKKELEQLAEGIDRQ